MCNLYSLTTAQKAILELARALRDLTGNLAPLPGIYPDYAAPVVRTGLDGTRELAMARWGMPSPSTVVRAAAEKRAVKLRAKGTEPDLDDLIRREPDGGVTNLRNPKSPHWRRWLDAGSRCLVPFNSFSEPEYLPDGRSQPAWFAFDGSRPLAFFAGVTCRDWRSVRKVREGETTNDLFAFLTCPPNAEVGALHPKAMPVILTAPDEWETWLTAPTEEALRLQRPLPDGSLSIVARGEKEDGVVADLAVAPSGPAQGSLF